jgi:hypothetical protein
VSAVRSGIGDSRMELSCCWWAVLARLRGGRDRRSLYRLMSDSSGEFAQAGRDVVRLYR